MHTNGYASIYVRHHKKVCFHVNCFLSHKNRIARIIKIVIDIVYDVFVDCSQLDLLILSSPSPSELKGAWYWGYETIFHSLGTIGIDPGVAAPSFVVSWRHTALLYSSLHTSKNFHCLKVP